MHTYTRQSRTSALHIQVKSRTQRGEEGVAVRARGAEVEEEAGEGELGAEARREEEEAKEGAVGCFR